MLQAVDDALVAPGEIVRKAIYQHIAANYQLEHEEIPKKLESSTQRLREMKL